MDSLYKSNGIVMKSNGTVDDLVRVAHGSHIGSATVAHTTGSNTQRAVRVTADDAGLGARTLDAIKQPTVATGVGRREQHQQITRLAFQPNNDG